MAVTYGFYDSVGGDRKYNAEEFSRLFDGIIVDGVFHSVGDVFKVKPGTGMQVIVGTGRAWFDGTWTYNDADLPISLDSPDVLGRIDAVVIEINRDILHRKNEIKIIKGTPSTSPVKPALANTDTLSQHALAYITVKSDATSIDVTNIEGVVGKSECPFVTGPLTTVDVDYLFSTWEGDFNEWFETVKDTLSGDVAGNLLNEINKVREESAYNTHCAIGDIITSNRKDFYPTLTNPNYLPCDGRILDEEAYPELTAELASLYGTNFINVVFDTSLREVTNIVKTPAGSVIALLNCANNSGDSNSVETHKYNFNSERFEKTKVFDLYGGRAPCAIAVGANDEVFVVGSNGGDSEGPYPCFYSDDGGVTWTQKGNMRGSGVGHESISMYYDPPSNTLFSFSSIGSYSPPLYYWYVSRDKGQTWSKLADTPTDDRKSPNVFLLGDGTAIAVDNYSSSFETWRINLSDFTATFESHRYDEYNDKFSSLSLQYVDKDTGRVFATGYGNSKYSTWYTEDFGATWIEANSTKGFTNWIDGPEGLIFAKSSEYSGYTFQTKDGITWAQCAGVESPNSGSRALCTSGRDFWFDVTTSKSPETSNLYRVTPGKKLANLPGFYVRCK